MTPRPATRTIWNVIPYLLIAYLYFYILLVQHTSLHQETAEASSQGLQRIAPPAAASSNTHDAGRSDSSSGPISNAWRDRRIQLLETKLNTYLSFGSDPFLATKTPAKCLNQTKLMEYCPYTYRSCHLGMPVCLDNFPLVQETKMRPCLVYDFGIREQPDFGVILSQAPFSCQVMAFDPSPITQKWYASPAAKNLRDNQNYHLFNYGGGGADENIILREYNWDQVSVYSYPSMVLNPNNCTNGRCRYKKFTAQKQHNLPVRSVESIMKEFGHDHIDILKIDVEGSEYRMLEALIESGVCKKVDQLTLEWHHYDFDLRYGAASVPVLNMLVKLLQDECGLYQYWIHDMTGWPSNEKIYDDMNIVLRYNIAAFMRIKNDNN